MGNQHTSDDFNTSDWTKIGDGSNFSTLWQNNHNPCIHIQQYLVNAKNEEQLNLERQFYFQRKNHPYWVAAFYFHQQNLSTGCMRGNAAHIYIQKIPLTICDLRQLTPSDLIHTYSQCLQGFKALAQILGFFRVYDKYIGINERGIVKVWVGSQWSRVGMIFSQITEEEMVESILYCLKKFSIAVTHQLPPLNDFLHRNNAKLTFKLVLQELRSFAQRFNKGIIPNRIQTLCNTSNFAFFDPLIRSKHYHFGQSRYMPGSQASNSSLFKYQKKDQNTISKIKEIKEQNKSLKKLNNNKNSNIFNCLSVQQQKKTSRVFTKQEIIRHYADFFQTDEEKSKNNNPFQQNTSLLSHHMKSNSNYNAQSHTTIQRSDMKQIQNYYPHHQYNNKKPYSFHPVLKQQQQPHNNIAQNHADKLKNLLRESDNQDSRGRGKSLGINSQKQFQRFIPQFSIKSLNNNNSQMSTQVSLNFQSQKKSTLTKHTYTIKSRTKFLYLNHSTIRNPLNIMQPNFSEHSKFVYRTTAQRSYV